MSSRSCLRDAQRTIKVSNKKANLKRTFSVGTANHHHHHPCLASCLRELITCRIITFVFPFLGSHFRSSSRAFGEGENYFRVRFSSSPIMWGHDAIRHHDFNLLLIAETKKSSALKFFLIFYATKLEKSTFSLFLYANFKATVESSLFNCMMILMAHVDVQN